MALTNKQKNWIRKNSEKYSSKKIAEELNVAEDLVREFLNSQQKKKTPFYFYIILICLPILFFILLGTWFKIIRVWF